MGIFIKCVVVIVLTMLGYAYLCYQNIKENGGEIINLKEYVPNSVKKIFILVFPLIIGTIVIITQEIFYKDLSSIHQVKLICIILIIFPIAVLDYKKHIVPNGILIFALILRITIYLVEFIMSPANMFVSLKGEILGALIIGGFFLLCLLIFKGSIGMGDIKLFFVMGLYQGLIGCINAIFCSLLISFVLSISLLISKKKTRKDAIPFCPSIFIGTLISIIISGV